MFRQLFILTGALFCTLSLSTASYAEKIYQCPDADIAKTAFGSGDVKDWPNYSEGPAGRVQRQHPDTAIIGAQAKFIRSEKGDFAICQYYTHIGMLITTGFFVEEKGDGVSGGYWRSEYSETHPEQDKKGREMIDVCMEKADKAAFPSVKCQFILLGD